MFEKIKSALYWIVDRRYKRILLKNPGIKIDPSTRINAWRKLNFLSGGSLQIGKNCVIDGSIVSEHPEAYIKIGHDTFIGGSHLICSKEITIGNDVLIAWGCTIVDHNSHALSFPSRKNDVTNWYKGIKDWSTVKSNAVKINDKVWIGFNSIILEGVAIGEGAIVGAGSVVTKDVAPWTIVAGNPAKIIRKISSDER